MFTPIGKLEALGRLELEAFCGRELGGAEREPAAEIPSVARDLDGKLEALGRLELPTRGLGNRCSIHLSYRAHAT